MDPIPDREDMGIILADLEDGEGVNIGLHGKISHSVDCKTSVDEHRQISPAVRLTHRTITVDLEYPSRLLGDVGSVHPNFRVVNPPISLRTHPQHPHFINDPRSNDSWACPISAQDTTWGWESGGTVNYLDHCAIWLLKSAVWVATGGGILPGFGRWLGPDTSHQPQDVVRETALEGPCRCGQGRRYKDCCFHNDVGAMIQRDR